MKKIISILLAVLMLVSIFASCGGNDETTTTEIPTTEAPTTEAPTTEAPTTEIPTTEVPTTEAPTTEIPTTRPVGEYSISYELNGGTNNDNNPNSYNSGDTITLSFPTKEDYMFMGWYTDSEFTNEIKEIANKAEDLTLYSKWISIDEVLEFASSSEGGYKVKKLKSEVERLIIPSTYKGLPVTELAGFSFHDANCLREVVISYGITTIKIDAFYGCESLETITLPSSIEYIDTITSSVFGECYALKSINVDPNNKIFKSIDGVLYSKDGKSLIRYPSNKIDTSFTIPNGVTNINRNAFSECTNLVRITVPNSVVFIDGGAFYKCKSLENIEIPNGVTAIEDNTFSGCISLKEIVIPNGVNMIDINAFMECTALEKIVIPGSVKTIKMNAFGKCTVLKSVIMEEGVNAIEKMAFAECTSLKTVIIPNSVTTIGHQAFVKCTSLNGVEIPESVTTIEHSAFYDNPNLTVYCKAASKPDGWNNYWSNGTKAVVWGYQGEE